MLLEDKDLFLSSVTIGEIQAGIEITKEQDLEKAHQIEQKLFNPFDGAYY